MDNTLYYVDESLYEQYVVGDPENESLWTLDIYEEIEDDLNPFYAVFNNLGEFGFRIMFCRFGAIRACNLLDALYNINDDCYIYYGTNIHVNVIVSTDVSRYPFLEDPENYYLFMGFEIDHVDSITDEIVSKDEYLICGDGILSRLDAHIGPIQMRKLQKCLKDGVEVEKIYTYYRVR